jgi:formylglycine-generating enzyme required for sulfatase activity
LKREPVFPANRAALFAGFVRVLLERERLRNHADWLGEDALNHTLAELAFAIQPLGEGTRLPRAEIASRIPTQIAGKDGMVATPAATVVRLGLAATLLDTEMSPDGQEHIRFYHHQLQEYFAAQQLLTMWRKGQDHTTRWRVPRLKNEMPDPRLEKWEVIPPPPGTGWEEPTILASGLTREAERATFVEAVGKINPILAARCLTEAGIPTPAETKTKTQNDLLNAMTDVRVHLRYRIAAGDALGKLGDPRLQEIDADGTRVLIPPFVEIPGGPFWMGSGWWDTILTWLNTRETPDRDDEPRHQVDVLTFYIAQFPVTNVEYACFIRAGGYEDEHWWKTQAARAWLKKTTEHKPRYWNDAQYNNSAQPVAGVTWYEANAYCAWMTDRIQNSIVRCQIEEKLGINLQSLRNATQSEIKNLNLEIRLPTEAEWEKAARGRNGRQYAWGNVWNRERANTGDSNTRRTTPVGIYPNGGTPEQVYDLAGNLWEWTSTLYRKYPYQNDERENPEGEDARVVRGGSFNYSSWFSRCASRLLYNPVNLFRRQGLRVVLSPIRL